MPDHGPAIAAHLSNRDGAPRSEYQPGSGRDRAVPRYASGVNEPKRRTDPAQDFAEIWDRERHTASHLRLVTGGLLVLLVALSIG